MSEIEYETGKYGLRAIIKSAWSEKIGQEVKSHHCAELEINHAKGWRGVNLDFLHECSWLKALKIIDFNIKSVEPIHSLHNLHALEVMTYCRTELRFSEFPQIQECALEWRPHAESLFECAKLKNLFINNFNGKNLIQFSKLLNLECLAVLNSSIESLVGIEPLSKLRTLRLGNLKKLHSLSGIEVLINLEELDVNTCKRIATINEVSALSNLRKLYINNNGDIASLQPINDLENLDTVIFYESTNIVDGDLSPLIRQASISRVSFKNRRHYSLKREDIVTLLSAR